MLAKQSIESLERKEAGCVPFLLFLEDLSWLVKGKNNNKADASI